MQVYNYMLSKGYFNKFYIL